MRAGFVALARITCLYATFDVLAHGLPEVLGSHRFCSLADAHVPLASNIMVVVKQLSSESTSGDARTITSFQQPHVFGVGSYRIVG